MHNSPAEILAASMPPGSTIALSTTNDAHVVEAATRAPCILAGSFANATVVADALSTGFAGERVTVVGSGWKERRASEDEAAAGAILRRLKERASGSTYGPSCRGCVPFMSFGTSAERQPGV